MPVYLIRAGILGPVKIGKADNPVGRLGELQVAHYETLFLIRMWEGGEAEEAALHVRFADLRIRGEWFSFSRLMIGDVGLVEIITPVDEPTPMIVDAVMQDGMELIRSQRGLLAKVAHDLGFTRAAVVKWDRVPAEYLPAVEKATGIPRHQLRPDICPPPSSEEAA